LRDSIFQRPDAGAGFIENNQPLSLPLRRALIPAWRFQKAGRKPGSPVESQRDSIVQPRVAPKAFGATLGKPSPKYFYPERVASSSGKMDATRVGVD
jgi:hypothetical protein